MMLRLLLPHLLALLFTLLIPASPVIAVDHAELISGKFKTGPDVTAKCLECHEDAGKQILQTSHWTWSLEQKIAGKTVKRGKINSFNNYCIAVYSNLSVCTRCHIGYGWTDHEFDFNNPENIDCLICHDSTGTYSKSSDQGGSPKKHVDLLDVARNVALPERINCGFCHFYGGGDDAVKHGDLDSSMDYPERQTDVHMDHEGNDFKCQTCHLTEKHLISGNSMTVSPTGKTGIGCVNCHSETPHKDKTLNKHTSAVACQTCHIPTYAKEIPTKTSWDWSTAGQRIKAKKDEFDKPNYTKNKGHVTYDKNITPTYAWYNGSADVHQLGEKISSDIVLLTSPGGDINDNAAKIYPFKMHTGKQPFDEFNKILITPKLVGRDGYWRTFDWEKASRIGMVEVGLPFSGQIDFIETEMYWPLNHMVSPADMALRCSDCHSRKGRLDWQKLGYKGDPKKTGKPR